MTDSPQPAQIHDASGALALLRRLSTEAARARDPQSRTHRLLKQAAQLVGASMGTLMLGNTLDQGTLVGTDSPLDLPRDLLAEAMLERGLASRRLEGGAWGVAMPLLVGPDAVAQLYLQAEEAPSGLSLELLETYAPFMAQLLYEANARALGI